MRFVSFCWRWLDPLLCCVAGVIRALSLEASPRQVFPVLVLCVIVFLPVRGVCMKGATVSREME